MCVYSFLISSVFFTLGTRLRISKFCVDLCKKKKKHAKKNKQKKKQSDRTRGLAVQSLSTISDSKLRGPRYNINLNSKSAERAKAFWFSEGRTK